MRHRFGGSEPEFKLYPKATYELELDEVTKGNSRTKGTPQLVVKAHIVSDAERGGKVTLFYVLGNENAGWRTKALLDAAGVEYKEYETDRKNANGKPIKEWDFDDEDLLGCRIMVDADTEVWEGQTRQRWSNERPPAGAVSSNAAPTNGGGRAQAPAAPPPAEPVVRRARRVQP
jgi:hypothetical protein